MIGLTGFSETEVENLDTELLLVKISQAGLFRHGDNDIFRLNVSVDDAGVFSHVFKAVSQAADGPQGVGVFTGLLA